MSSELKRIIILSVINGIAIHYLNKWLDEKKVLPSTPSDNE